MQLRKIAVAISKSISKPVAYEGEPQTFTKEQVDAAVAEAVKGLKSNNESLLGEKKKVQEDLNKIKETLTAFEGVDAKEYKELMAYFQNNEEARLIKEGKIDQVIDARTKRAIDDANKRVKDA